MKGTNNIVQPRAVIQLTTVIQLQRSLEKNYSTSYLN